MILGPANVEGEWEEEGGDARPKEEFRRKMYAFAIPRRISLEGSGVADRWIMLARRRKRRYEREARFFSRSMPKGETSSPSVPSYDSLASSARYLGINFFRGILFLSFFPFSDLVKVAEC